MNKSNLSYLAPLYVWMAWLSALVPGTLLALLVLWMLVAPRSDAGDHPVVAFLDMFLTAGTLFTGVVGFIFALWSLLLGIVNANGVRINKTSAVLPPALFGILVGGFVLFALYYALSQGGI
jgi:hypothetical protein